MATTVMHNVGSGFQDFDEASVFDAISKSAASNSCVNFVVEFGHDRARVARNLELEQFKGLYPNDGANRLIRWINIWDTSKQPAVMDFLGERYNFSPRMINIMKRASDFNQKAVAKSVLPTKRPNTSSTPKEPTKETISIDLEKGRATTASGSQSPDPGSTRPKLDSDVMPKGDDVKLFLLLKNKVNYSSIDQTENALCIGAHWLHDRPQMPAVVEKPKAKAPESLMPPKHWLWLVLCDDNTVLSLHEDPVIEEPAGLDAQQLQEYRAACFENIRANTLSVLLQLSERGSDRYAHKPLSQSSVRKALSDKFHRSQARNGGSGGMDHLARLRVEGASNLFYYLFEDYAAAATFYAAERTLKDLTPIVLASDTRKMKNQTAGIIPRLHSLGKDLRELKHLFENYKAMIQKILQTTKPEYHHNNSNNTRGPRGSVGGGGDVDMASDIMAPLLTRSMSVTGYFDDDEPAVAMAKSARERFERLGERLQWLMLNTIQGYQDETAALSDTYFNLMQQKDTAATARLNRSATLLAKLSVFFLPLSFVTSYYSIQIEEMYQSWVTWDFDRAIAITVSVSFFALFFFNKILFLLIDALDRGATRVEVSARSTLRAAGRVLVRRKGRVGDADDDDDEVVEGRL